MTGDKAAAHADAMNALSAMPEKITGDAATATLVAGADHAGDFLARLHPPLTSATGEDGSTLTVPLPGPGRYLRMKGPRVFTEAVRTGSKSWTRTWQFPSTFTQPGITGNSDLSVPSFSMYLFSTAVL